jgi:TPR repeat protein
MSVPVFRRFLLALLLPVLVLLPAGPALASEDALEAEPPRVVAALEQGLAAELGNGLVRNPELAIALYCDAGTLGSPEGFFRVGRVLVIGPAYLRNPALANAYFALAARLGHRAASEAFDEAVPSAPLEESCGSFSSGFERQGFDLDAYVSGLSPARRRIADMIRHQARRYGIDERIALAVAMAESNLNSRAVSPMNAQGVMQLIPATQARFGVKDAFDAESNVRGGLAYLKWLKARYHGDWGLVTAAYNAGEGAVDRYRGIPPFRETRDYVRRVLFFAGLARKDRL